MNKLFKYTKKTDKLALRGKDTYLEFTHRVVWWKNSYSILLNYDFVTNGQVVISKKYFNYSFITKNIEANNKLLQLKNIDGNFFNLSDDLSLTDEQLFCEVSRIKSHKLNSGQYINDDYIDLFKSKSVIAKPLGKDVLSPIVFFDKNTNDIIAIVAAVQVINKG
jgi:hypothetical protein